MLPDREIFAALPKREKAAFIICKKTQQAFLASVRRSAAAAKPGGEPDPPHSQSKGIKRS